MAINISDRLSFKDKEITNPRPKVQMPSMGHPQMWARTEIIGGYGDVKYNPHGKSTLGEVLFSETNTVPIGGVQYTMEKLFGITGPISIPTLYNPDTDVITGVGKPDSANPTDTFKIPGGTKTITYRTGNEVCLFGIGTTGAAENDVTVYPVDYRENSINLSKVSSDGTTINGIMLPFRYTDEVLSDTDRKRYFGKLVTDGTTGYYLKRFENTPAIRHLWSTGEDDETETEVTSDEVWENNTGRNTIETFTEIVLKIDKKDVKEWFNALDQEDRTRVNTIALFYGEYVIDSGETMGDYRDVRMFSKLNIPVEYLSLSKDLNIIYRVYGS